MTTQECADLRKLYNHYPTLRNSSTEQDCCRWLGVFCNKRNNVVALLLSNMNLRGPMPDIFEKLVHLQRLLIENNQLTIPWPLSLAKLPRLAVLRISNNSYDDQIISLVVPLLQLLYLNNHFHLFLQLSQALLLAVVFIGKIKLKHTAIGSSPSHNS